MTKTTLRKDLDRSFEGYHKFQGISSYYGPFEVFWHNDMEPNTPLCVNNEWEEGWYWHACYPGCLPDGEPNGPFPTAEGAYLDAIGD